MFKRLILAAAIVLIASVSQAADLKFSGLNASGDTLYLPSSGSFAVGIGSDIASINSFIDIRAHLVTEVTKDQDNKAGIGLGINLPKLVSYLGGSWVAEKMNASIGATALVNLDGDAHIEPALYLSLINWSY